jgi:UPF0755 protein
MAYVEGVASKTLSKGPAAIAGRLKLSGRVKDGYQTAEIETMQKLKAFKRISVLLLFTVMVLVLLGGLALRRYAKTPGSHLDRQVVFSIVPGEAFSQLAARLETEGVIISPFKFKLLARLKGADKRLRSGEYQLSSAMTPDQILEVLINGRAFLYRLTIPEGFTARQIAAQIASQGLGNEEEFMRLATDTQIAHDLGIEAQSLEGYLFPDTYYFPKQVAALTIVKKMVERFKEQFKPEWHERAHELNLSVHEVVTLASIIEKETGDPSERPLISSVFHNRLKKKMRLESDPTVIYGIKDFDGNLKRSHLTTPTPYNTYIIKGLPPGPIANPGQAAIEAALYPAQTQYLFFVSKQDHTHHFSATIAEHRRAVRKYQLHHRHRPGS